VATTADRQHALTEDFLNHLDIVAPKHDLSMWDVLDIMASDQFVFADVDEVEQSPEDCRAIATSFVESMASFGHRNVSAKRIKTALEDADLVLLAESNPAASEAYFNLVTGTGKGAA
jgi:hypothetical protein